MVRVFGYRRRMLNPESGAVHLTNTLWDALLQLWKHGNMNAAYEVVRDTLPPGSSKKYFGMEPGVLADEIVSKYGSMLRAKAEELELAEKKFAEAEATKLLPEVAKYLGVSDPEALKALGAALTAAIRAFVRRDDVNDAYEAFVDHLTEALPVDMDLAKAFGIPGPWSEAVTKLADKVFDRYELALRSAANAVKNELQTKAYELARELAEEIAEDLTRKRGHV